MALVPESSTTTLDLAIVVPAMRENGPRQLCLTGGTLAFLLEHGVQGWWPPPPSLAASGSPPGVEIDAEMAALGTCPRSPTRRLRMRPYRANERLQELRSWNRTG